MISDTRGSVVARHLSISQQCRTIVEDEAATISVDPAEPAFAGLFLSQFIGGSEHFTHHRSYIRFCGTVIDYARSQGEFVRDHGIRNIDAATSHNPTKDISI